MIKTKTTDILVLGSGIAGVTSAIFAASKGMSVIMASSAQTFSGSSFYPGTWGLGLIGPEDEEDIDNLIETIHRIGKGIPVKSMVDTFVRNLNPVIDEFEKLGIDLAKPTPGSEQEIEYIPCFDYKIRRWRGLTKENLRSALPKIMADLNIEVLPFFEAIELIKDNDQIKGAVGIKNLKDLMYIKSKATILATGGLSGLYKRYLTTSDVTGVGLAMALRAGAKGINLEFTQMMLGFVDPGAKTVHNEKTFTASRFYNQKDQLFLEKALPKDLNRTKILEERRKHGPFSSETISKFVDVNIFKEILNQEEKSVTLRYDIDKLNMDADFTKTYFDWLKSEKSISVTDDIKIAPYMHASNGGVFINEKSETGVVGLYAAGEVTGGMHGADRIGGLATASGLVFGKFAGENAADYVLNNEIDLDLFQYKFKEIYIENAKEKIESLREILDKNAFLIRSEENLDMALQQLPDLLKEQKESGSIKDLKRSYHLYNAVISAMALVSLQKARKESRGSHYREDYPNNEEAFSSPLLVELKPDLNIKEERSDLFKVEKLYNN